MVSGTVKFFRPEKGFGFIKVDGQARDVFVHIKDMRACGLNSLEPEEAVTFDLLDSARGMRAVNIRRLTAVVVPA